MIFRFLDFELDVAAHELRREGIVVDLQPRVYSVLEYLVRHRERAVSKDELLAEVWVDAVVGDSSVQRAVSLLRASLGDSQCIRTVPRHGYRFAAAVDVDAAPIEFRPSFVVSGDVHVAYHTLGQGTLDLVLIPGWVFPMRALLDLPAVGDWVQELTRFGRVVLFDKRGTGLSDRVKKLPTLAQRVDDLRAVLDAIGSTRAVLIGASEGGPLSLVYAASYPDRVHGLILCSSFARWSATTDYPHGFTPEIVDGLRRYIREDWGRGETLRAVVASRGDEPEIIRWAARAEQEGASPGAARELMDMNLRADVRHLLPSITVPTAVFHLRDDAVISVECGRHLAEHIPHARWIECEGVDHMPFFQGREQFFDALAWLVEQPSTPPERFLTTILATHGAAQDRQGELAAMVTRFGGRATGSPGAWSFDGPERAVRCGLSMLATLGDDARIGVHIGEIERRGGALLGDAIDVAGALVAAAWPGEVWVARVVRDLVHGSDLAFEPRGEVELDDGRVVPMLTASSESDGT